MKAAPPSSSVVPDQPQASIGIATDSPTVLQLLEERIDVAVERVDAGALRVRIVVDESVENAAVDLVSTEVRPTVVARNVEVSERRQPYADGEDLIVPVYEERAVVVRKLFLREEVRLTRIRHVQQQALDVSLRRERAVVERQQPDGSWLAEHGLSQGTPLAGPSA